MILSPTAPSARISPRARARISSADGFGDPLPGDPLRVLLHPPHDAPPTIAPSADSLSSPRGAAWRCRSRRRPAGRSARLRARTFVREVGRQAVALAGDAGHRQVVDEPAAEPGDLAAAFGRVVGATSRIVSSPPAGRCRTTRWASGGGRSGMISPSNPAALASADEPGSTPVPEHDAVAHHRRPAGSTPRPRTRRDGREHVADLHLLASACGERLLDDRPVGDRVGEREADLDHGRARPARAPAAGRRSSSSDG